MEREKLLTGYCRALDHSRMVMAAEENGQLTDIDCDYPGCAHAPVCPVAKAIDEFLKGE
jgi:hypothetical protein